MHQGQYVMVCKSIGCDPRNGVSIDALRLVYAADGTSIGESVFNHVFAQTIMEMYVNANKNIITLDPF